MLSPLDIPLEDAFDTAAALGRHVGARLRLTDRSSGAAVVPWVNPLVGGGSSSQLSGTDFVLRDVTADTGRVDLMVEDCGTGKRWRLFFLVPDADSERWRFNEVAGDGMSAADARRDDWLRDVFS